MSAKITFFPISHTFIYGKITNKKNKVCYIRLLYSRLPLYIRVYPSLDNILSLLYRLRSSAPHTEWYQVHPKVQ